MLDTLRRVIFGTQEHPYTYLLIAILLLLVIAPPITQAFGIRGIEDYLFIVVFIAALNNVAVHRRHVIVGVLLGLPAIAVRVFAAYTGELSRTGYAVVIVPTLLFFCYLVWHVLNDVLRGRRLTAEKITGAIVAYLLIGLIWSLAYLLVAVIQPSSFRIPDDIVSLVQSSPTKTAWSVFVYYSFITLTTLGYGDITPLGSTARTLSWIESVVGPLYLAILIARLVAIQVAEGRENTNDP